MPTENIIAAILSLFSIGFLTSVICKLMDKNERLHEKLTQALTNNAVDWARWDKNKDFMQAEIIKLQSYINKMETKNENNL